MEIDIESEAPVCTRCSFAFADVCGCVGRGRRDVYLTRCEARLRKAAKEAPKSYGRVLVPPWNRDPGIGSSLRVPPPSSSPRDRLSFTCARNVMSLSGRWSSTLFVPAARMTVGRPRGGASEAPIGSPRLAYPGER
jgi:hypothetical protein